jgi:hypothetical protein
VISRRDGPFLKTKEKTMTNKMQLAQETIKFLYNKLNEIEKDMDLSNRQAEDIYALMESLHYLYMGEPLEITLADE